MLNHTCYMIVDVESTGSNCGTDLIFEIAAIFIIKKKVVKEFCSFVYVPKKKIMLAKKQLSFIIQIDIQQVLQAPQFCVVFRELMSFVQQYKIGSIKFVAHNVKFDYNIMLSNARNFAYDLSEKFTSYFMHHQIDTIELAKQTFKQANRYSLSYIADYIAQHERNQHLLTLIQQRKRHTAIIDAKILVEIFINIQNKNPFLVT